MRIGWTVKRQSGSHRTLSREGWPDYVFAFHDSEEIGPRMLARIARRTGLRPEDLEWGPANASWLSPVSLPLGLEIEAPGFKGPGAITPIDVRPRAPISS